MKIHLFQTPKDTTILGLLHEIKMTPQISNLVVNGRIKSQIFVKKSICFRNIQRDIGLSKRHKLNLNKMPFSLNCFIGKKYISLSKKIDKQQKYTNYQGKMGYAYQVYGFVKEFKHLK